MRWTGPGYIYVITNQLDGKKYVGKTSTLHRRWVDHRSLYLKVDHPQCERKPLYRAMRKYGVENFTYSVLQKYECGADALNDEDRWIEKLQSRITQHGYNCTAGGAGPDRKATKRKPRKATKHTEASKKKMSESMAEAHRIERLWFKPILAELHSQGLNNKQIRDETGLGVATIRRWLKEDLGLHSPSRKRDPKLAVPEITVLAESGKTVKEIVLLVNCKDATVRRILAEQSLPVNKHQSGRLKGTLDPKFEAKKQAAIPVILELAAQGKTKKQIRRHVGMGSKFVGDVLKGNNWYIRRIEYLTPLVIDLWSKGHNKKQIRLELQCSWTTLTGILRDAGLI